MPPRTQRREESLAWLYGLRRFGMKLDLDAPRALLAALGDPGNGLRVLHVAGSNGKGSTAAVAEAILRAAGHRTGLYTSPHLVDFAERIRIDGRPIGRRDLARLVARVRPLCGAVAREVGRGVTFFEATTAMAVLHFADAKVDVAVLETGLGGRFDATNAIAPAVCAITPIALEHQRQLGRTLAAVAREKAGILKRGVPAAIGLQAPAAREVIRRRARALGARLALQGRDFDCTFGAASDLRARPVGAGAFDYRGIGTDLPGMRCGLPGPHQAANAALALAACEFLAEAGLSITARAMRAGVANVRWPGRMERVPRPRGSPRVVLDGAHNPAAARALARALPEAFPHRRLRLVLAAMADKDLRALVRPLARAVHRAGGSAIATAPAFERAADPRALAAILRAAGVRTEVVRRAPDAVDRAIAGAGIDDLVLVTGSLYLVGEARAHLLPSAHRRSVLPGPV
jgi:dihydrofolate synthase/folylpolyglutamate synthase